jgi:hypothetical protein
MRIIDISAGNRAIWFDKFDPSAVFVDIRPEVKPDIVFDTRYPFPKWFPTDFDLVVYDPPHVNCGANGEMSKRYGSWTTSEILDSVYLTSTNLLTITKETSLMALKWNDHDIKVPRILERIQHWRPLFGHQLRNMGGVSKGRVPSQSYWIMLCRNWP